MQRSALSVVLLLTAFAGCVDGASTPTALAPDAPLFARPASNSDTDPRAVWEYHDTFVDASSQSQASMIRGDGRAVDGTGGTLDPSVYQGDQCGVDAKIFAGGSGDAVLDPDKNYKVGRCSGGRRYLRFDLGGGDVVTAGAFTNAFGVSKYSQGEARDTVMHYRYNNIPNCEILRFSNETMDSGVQLSPVRITRLPDTSTGAQQWNVESLPPHTAGCANWSKGAYRLNGSTYTMPFRAVVTEIR